MFRVEFDIKGLTSKLSDAEKRQLPFALIGALNDTAFDVRSGWHDQIGRVFDSPVQLTRNAVLYTKATKQDIAGATIFIRDEASAGTPPVKYLAPEEYGGPRRQKGFERLLAGSRSILNPGTFYLPGSSLPLDPHGNIPRRLFNKIFAQIGALEARNNESAKGRGRRLRRQRRQGGGGSYFVLNRAHGKLRPGVIYEREDFGITSGVTTVLFPVSTAPTYRKRFGAIDLAKKLAAQKFPANFAKRMAQAIRTAR